MNEPGGHTSQLEAWFALYLLSAPQSEQLNAWAIDALPARHVAHDDAPPAAYVPTAQVVLLLVPSQEKPAGQGLQNAREIDVPPDAKEPGGHVLQLLAPMSLYWSSLPHAVQVGAPSSLSLYFPLGQ